MLSAIKTSFTGILTVLALTFAFGLFAQPAYAVDCANPTGIQDAASCARSNDQSESLFGDGGIFQQITNILLIIIGAVSVIMLVIGGIRYTVSNGDQAAVKSAKDTILYALIGIVVALLAYAAVSFVLGSIGNQNP